MERQMDVRSIELRKPFYATTGDKMRYCFPGDTNMRLSLPFDKINESNVQWEVWGHYNELKISKVDVDGDSWGLRRMWDHACELSGSLVGAERMHAQFAITYDYPENIENFWLHEHEYPLIMVSVIHLKHLQNKRIIQTEVKDTISYKLQDILSNENVRYICYFSLDSCDVIIFWLSSSYQSVMDAIAKLCCDDECLIQDIFSIQGFQRQYARNADSTCALTEKIPLAQFVLRGNRLQTVRKYAKSLLSALQLTAREVYLLPGQDDATVLAYDVPLHTLIQIVKPEGILDADQLIRNGLYSHTTLGYGDGVSPKQEHGNRNSPTPLVSRKLFVHFKHEIDRLPAQTRRYISSKAWYAALCELFNELSNIESGSTAHDIFTQEIYCQGRFVELLLAQLKSGQYKDPNSKFDACVQLYLHGWSQLSFHAMHSEWQLTQAYDSNRLYIYPAKLSLFYSAYMHHAAVWLNDGSTNDLCTFFLTPKLATDPQFYGIFSTLKKHTMLVLGEIPAELLFRPAELLPVLAHEAAHYTGGSIRCRDSRLKYILLSVAFVYMDHFAQTYPTYYNMNNQQKSKVLEFLYESYFGEKVDSVIDRWLNKELRFGETINIADQLIGELKADEEKQFWLDCAIAGAFSDYDLQIINANPLDNKANINAASFENVDALIALYKNLRLMYREAFADLCMVSMLNMSRIDYLKCLARMLDACQSNMTEELTNRTAHFERCVAVLRVMSKLSINDNDEKLATLIKQDLEKDPDLFSGLDSQTLTWINGLIERLSGTRSASVRINNYAATFFELYLEECQAKIETMEQPDIAEIFRIFTTNDCNAYFNDVYKQCNRITGMYIDFTREYLRKAMQ